MLALRPSEDGEAPDEGLPIVELFHRKSPQALELPGPGGKDYLGLWILGIGNEDADIIAGLRPIHFAVMNGHVWCLQRLLELGVDRDPRDKTGKTPLLCAATSGSLDAVEVLVVAGADLSAKDKKGKTAAQLAKADGFTAAARYLVEQSVQRARAAAGPSSS